MTFLEKEIKSKNTRGYIEVICGSMFSGKTEKLLSRLNRAKYAKLETALFKSKIDTRYEEKDIVSHNKNKLPCIVIDNPQDIFKHISNKTMVIGIDEGQFFDKTLIDVCNKLANKGKIIIIAGLDMDSSGNPFGIMPKLLAIAEKIKKVHAICEYCGDKANYSYRKDNKGELIHLGHSNIYQALCRKCFYKKK